MPLANTGRELWSDAPGTGHARPGGHASGPNPLQPFTGLGAGCAVRTKGLNKEERRRKEEGGCGGPGHWRGSATGEETCGWGASLQTVRAGLAATGWAGVVAFDVVGRLGRRWHRSFACSHRQDVCATVFLDLENRNPRRHPGGQFRGGGVHSCWRTRYVSRFDS